MQHKATINDARTNGQMDLPHRDRLWHWALAAGMTAAVVVSVCWYV
ncbi:hypothetical protein [Cupriavidus pauculus]